MCPMSAVGWGALLNRDSCMLLVPTVVTVPSLMTLTVTGMHGMVHEAHERLFPTVMDFLQAKGHKQDVRSRRL